MIADSKSILAMLCVLLAGLSERCLASEPLATRPTLLLVVGAPGQSDYCTNFLQQALLWTNAGFQAGARQITIGASDSGQTNDFDLLKQALESEPKNGPAQLWMVLIGHGTFDGKEARFNLRGPDLSASDLAAWLRPFRRPLAVINTSSSSGPFLNKLSASNRVVITATRSGYEQYFTRFGLHMAESVTDPKADLDKDGEISVFEAFLVAARQAAEFYKLENRISTEHALLDDNGDLRGTPAEWFEGLRPTKRPDTNSAAIDGSLARQFRFVPGEADRNLTPEQRAQRDELERAVLLYREKKSQVSEAEYYRQLEHLLLELARFYETTPASPALAEPAPPGS